MNDVPTQNNIETKGANVHLVTFHDLAETARQINNGWLLLWQHHAIHLGMVINGEITWANASNVMNGHFHDHFVQLRAFNESEEYNFWKTAGSIKGRLITDDLAEVKNLYTETAMIVRGVIAEQYFLLVPNMKTKEEEKLTTRTRNYIHFNEIGQAGYVDSRFVDFTIQNSGK